MWITSSSAEVICDAVACAERVRYVSTGGEADMYAMRLARAHTKRDKIVKFEGGYHGMSAEALISLFPERIENYPNGLPDSAGILDSVRTSMLIAPFNDAEFARQLITERRDEIAAVIVESLQRLIPPEPGFLQVLREETAGHGIILIFDEVRYQIVGDPILFDVVFSPTPIWNDQHTINGNAFLA